jgi:predicted AAA+ superfamily ATPase
VDVKGLALLKTGAKYYAVDTGLRYWMNGNRAGDSGRVLENIVYLELLRRHRNVFTVVTRNGHEIDFVTRDGDDIRYYQVSESVKSSETLERELRPFKEIRDNYPRFLITADYGKPIMHEGIRQLSVFDFLLNTEI